MPYADVAVQVPAQPGVRRPTTLTEAETGIFSYSVPEHLASRVQVGQWVWVPFGTRHLAGVVLNLDGEPPAVELRPIADILDDRPVLGPKQLQVARWMSRYYLAPLFDCVSLFLPPGTAPKTETVYSAGPAVGRLSPLEQRLRNLLAEHQTLTAPELAALLEHASLTPDTEPLTATSVAAELQSLAQRGAVQRRSRLAPPRIRASTKPRVRLMVDEGAALRLAAWRAAASARARLLLALAEAQERGDPLQELAASEESVGVSPSTFKQAVRGAPIVTIEPQTLYEAPAAVADAADPDDLPDWVRDAGPRTAAEWQSLGLDAAALQRLVEQGSMAARTVPAQITLAVDARRAYEEILDQARPAGMSTAVLQLARFGGSAWLDDLMRLASCSRLAVERLAETGAVSIEERRYYRDRFLSQAGDAAPLPVLTEEQQEALEPIVAALDGGRAEGFLLQGVTGSGKTEVYLHAVHHALSMGRRSIVLVPEIALTPQTLSRFGRYFPGRVAVQHSGLTAGERYDQWTRVRDGEADVVIGPRSALFMPLPNCGLVIMDEEHEPSYKQASRPHYHARDAAQRLARELGSALVLGSATPDVATYRAAERGALRLLRLRHRFGGEAPLALPPVQVVDMRTELRDGHTGLLSRPLLSALSSVLERGEQAILFLNRRGTSTFVMCRDCGHVVQCRRCDLPLTYHAANSRPGNGPGLVCHHCGLHEDVPRLCPQCGSTRIRYFGAGTERVQAYTQTRFPQARIARWDWDTTRHRGGHEAILEGFLRHEADILIGTQMIAKGLDLPLVTLVGVVSADVSLFFPDFRAGERTFQLLTQVVGRAGRREGGGRAIVQTYHPDHYALQAASRHDYDAFYAREIALRRRLGYPPFGQMVRLLYSDVRAARAERNATDLAQGLHRHIRRRGLPNLEVIGPAPCFYSRIRGRFRWHILLRGQGAQELLLEEPVPAGWRVDVDPLDFL